MPLKKQYLDIPLHQGVNTKTDPKQVPIGQTLQADNLYYVTEKMVRKRPGSVEVAAPINARWISSTNDQLVVGTDSGVNVQVDLDYTTAWASRNRAPKIQYTEDSIWASRQPVADATGNYYTAPPDNISSAHIGTYAVVAWNEVVTTSSFETASVIYYGIFDYSTNNWVTAPVQLTTTAGVPTTARSPKVVFDSSNSRIYIFYRVYNSSSFDFDLRYQVRSISGTGVPTFTTSFIDNLYAISTGDFGYDVLHKNGYIYVLRPIAGGSLIFDRVSIGLNGLLTIATTTTVTGHSSARHVALAANNNYIALASSAGAVDFAFASTGAVVPAAHIGGICTNPEYDRPIVCTFDDSYSVPTLFCALTQSRSVDWGQTIATPMLELLGLTGPPILIAQNSLKMPSTSAYAAVVSGISVIGNEGYVWVAGSGAQITSSQWTALLLHVTHNTTNSSGSVSIDGYGLYQAAGELWHSGPYLEGWSKGSAKSKPYVSVSDGRISFLLPKLTGHSLRNYTGAIAHLMVDVNPAVDVNPRRTPNGLNIPSAYPHDYDGNEVFPSGFLFAPELPERLEAAQGAFPGLSEGTYQWVAVYAFKDRFGDVYRSAPSPAVKFMLGAPDVGNAWQVIFAGMGHSENPLLANGLEYYIAGSYIELYRTEANGTEFFFDRVFARTDTLLIDSLPDTDLTDNEELYTSQGETPNDPQPPTSYVAAIHNRMWAVNAEDRSQIFYSKPFRTGHPVEWSALQVLQTDKASGPVVALARLDEKYVILKGRSVFVFVGDGPDVSGTGGTFSLPVQIPTDCGCLDPASVVSTTEGVYFKSQRGLVRLNRSLTLDYVGLPVDTYTETITAAAVMPAMQHLRFMMASGKTLVYDYLFNRWSTFSGQPTSSATVLNDTLYYLTADKTTVRKEDPTIFVDGVTPITFTLETPWLKAGGTDATQNPVFLSQGSGRIYRMALLGSYKSSHALNIQLHYDYNSDDSDTLIFTPSTGLISGDQVYQFRMSRLPRQVMQALKLTITDSSTNGESCDISNIVLELGIKTGVTKLAPRKTL